MARVSSPRPVHDAFLRNTALILACSLLALLGSYATRILYARAFSPEEYGLLYAVITWLTILAMIRNLGMGDALTYFVARNPKNSALGRRALQITLAFQVALGALIVLVAALIGPLVSTTLIRDPRVPYLLVDFAGAFAVVGITESIVAYFRGRQQMLRVGASEPVRTILIALISFVALVLNKSLASIAFAWLAAYALSAVIYGAVLWQFSRNQKQARARSTTPLLSPMLRYAFPSFLATAGLFIFYNIDTVVITAMLGTYATGLYNAALPIANLLLLVTVPITIVVFPTISSLFGSGKRAELGRMHALAARIGLVASLACVVPLFVFGPQLLGYFFGSEYALAWDALRILLVAGLLRSLVEIEFAVLAGLGAVKPRAVLLGLALVCNTLLNILWVPRYGIAGAALATTVTFAALLFVTVLYARKAHGVRLPNEFFVRGIAAAVPLIVAGLWLAPIVPSISFPLLLSGMIVCGFVSLGWSAVCGLLTRADVTAGMSFVHGLLTPRRR